MKKVNYWTGAVNNEWRNPANWSCGEALIINSDIVVESGKATYPVISQDVTLRRLTILAGARVDVAPGVIRHKQRLKE